MGLRELCFEGLDGYVEISTGGLTKSHRSWMNIPHYLDAFMMVQGGEIYYGPAVRSSPDKMGKGNCRCSQVCWVDLDNEELPDTLLVVMPTAIVNSGGGFHIYWKLNEGCSSVEALEGANQSLARALGGDSAHNIDRMLRVPGSWNRKYEPPRQTALIHYDASLVYTLEELLVLEQLNRKSIHKIVTGDRRGYKSRSERDMAIVRALVSSGATDRLVHQIFSRCKCGDKYLEEADHGKDYLDRTIRIIRETTKAGPTGVKKGTEFVEEDNCYVVPTQRGKVVLSTFTLEPTLLLEGDNEDSIVCNVRARGTDYVWEDVVLPRSAFDSVRSLGQYLTKAAWIWLGRDADVRKLLALLISKLQDEGVPRAVATSVLGRHTLPRDGRTFFVSTKEVLASDGSHWPRARDAPIMYVDTGRERPDIVLPSRELEQLEVEGIGEVLPVLNDPGKIWPMIGWFMASPYKPALESLGYRFPILSVTGTRGSGKTTLVTKVFQPMLGIQTPLTYDVGTTQFVTLSLLGCANAIPVAFSEYRAATEGDFTRHVLLAYDTGRDARGNPNQTTTQYPLIVPFSIDGEDKIEDAAALERMIVVVLSPSTIEEGTDAWEAFQELQEMELRSFASPYIAHTLATDVGALISDAEDEVSDAFPDKLPDRVRRNLTVCWAGVLSFTAFMEKCKVFCHPSEGAQVLEHALRNVFSVDKGRAPLAADSFVEFVVNGAAKGTSNFPWSLDKATRTIWFQLAPSYESFATYKSRQGSRVLSKNALRIQLAELQSEYMVPPEVRTIRSRTVLAYGVDMVRAYTMGLDIPKALDTKTFTFTIENTRKEDDQ